MTMTGRIFKVIAIGTILTSVAFSTGCSTEASRAEKLRQEAINRANSDGSAMSEALASMRRAFR